MKRFNALFLYLSLMLPIFAYAAETKISGIPLSKFATGPKGTFTENDLTRMFLVKKYPELKDIVNSPDAALDDPNLLRMVQNARAYTYSMKLNLPGNPPYVLSDVQKAYKSRYPDELSIYGFRLRQSWESMSFSLPETNVAKAKPASIAFSRDFLKNSSSWTVHGALMYPFSHEFPEDTNSDSLQFTAVAFVPSVSLDKVTGVKQPVDSLVFRAANEDEFSYRTSQIGHRWISTHLLRIAPFYGTDTHFKSSQAGGELDYEPVNDDIGLGLFVGDLFPHRFRFFLHNEVGNVIDADGNTNLVTGNTYYRIGPDIGMDVQTKGLPGLTASVRFQDYERVTVHTRSTRLFIASLSYNIDPQGHIAIQAEYREGRIPLTAEKTKTLTLDLGLKF